MPRTKRTMKSSAGSPARPRPRRLRINLAAKGMLAVEPAIDRDPDHLHPSFRLKLLAALAALAGEGTPFKFNEGFRSVARQQWLYGSGRPDARPYGRPGPILTYQDGVTRLSRHQGTGTAGSGRAADCYPLRAGRVYIPPASDPVWRRYADVAIAQGLRAGLDFPTLKDAPHCELPMLAGAAAGLKSRAASRRRRTRTPRASRRSTARARA